MGGQQEFIRSGGFSQYLFHQVGEVIEADGVSGKILEKSGDDRSHDGLPKYSNTSRVYFKQDDVTRMVEQARIYEDRLVAYDFDWGHTHKEFLSGIVHVHEWYLNKNGKWVRSRNPRLMKDDEIRKYGKLLNKANPNVKFR